MKKSIRLCALMFCFISVLSAQQTVGLFDNQPESYNGYTLFAPTSAVGTYLIDNCGYKVHEWQGTSTPGLAVYLLENGHLVRTQRIQSGGIIVGGGSGGRIEIRDWNNALVWGYNIADTIHHQHHDVEPMPNGNMLVIAWERISKAEALANGVNPNALGTELWPDKIIELELIGSDSAAVVWEWHYWDHLIQDYDSTKLNYGVVADHPELIDVNLRPFGDPTASDWNHTNGIDYNPHLDQILISSRNFSEIFIIDHSTTTEEAASHSGGNSGKGGDLLYRWGNPQNYDRGIESDQKLFLQHNATWIPLGYPDEGKIMIYNNGFGRPEGNASSADIIDTPIDDDENYLLGAGNPYGPDTTFWTFSQPDFYSINISGAQPQPNGNVLICEGASGHFFEVTRDKNMVWRYINPITNNGPLEQGVPVIAGNNSFRAERYATDYPAFDGKDLTPIAPLELNPLPDSCVIYTNTMVSTPTLFELKNISLYPNPVLQNLIIEFGGVDIDMMLFITDAQGKIIHKSSLKQTLNRISTDQWSSGIYFIKIIDLNTFRSDVYKIIK